MKAKRGGDINESKLKDLFSDDPAMQAFLNVDCQRKFLVGTLNKLQKEAMTNKYGGMPPRRARTPEPEEEYIDEEELEMGLQRLPIQGQEQAMRCAPVQFFIAIILSLCVEVGAVLISSKFISLCFSQESDAISNIIYALIESLSANVSPQILKTFLAGFLGAAYVSLKKDFSYANIKKTLIQLLKSIPILSGRINAIIERAEKFCNSGLIPVGRGVTLEILKAKIINILSKKGFGEEAERLSRLERDIQLKEIEIAKEQSKRPARKRIERLADELEKKRTQEIPVIPSIGGPSGLGLFTKPKKSVKMSLKEEIKNIESMKEQERKEIKKTLRKLQEEIDDIDEEQSELEEVLNNRSERLQEARDNFSKETDPIRRNALGDNIKRLQENETELINRLEELRRVRPSIEKRILTIKEEVYGPLEVRRETLKRRLEEEEPFAAAAEYYEERRSPSRSPSRSPVQVSKKKSKKQRGEGGGKRKTYKKHNGLKTHKKHHGKKNYRKSRRS